MFLDNASNYLITRVCSLSSCNNKSRLIISWTQSIRKLCSRRSIYLEDCFCSSSSSDRAIEQYYLCSSKKAERAIFSCFFDKTDRVYASIRA